MAFQNYQSASQANRTKDNCIIHIIWKMGKRNAGLGNDIMVILTPMTWSPCICSHLESCAQQGRCWEYWGRQDRNLGNLLPALCPGVTCREHRGLGLAPFTHSDCFQRCLSLTGRTEARENLRNPSVPCFCLPASAGEKGLIRNSTVSLYYRLSDNLYFSFFNITA